jgi:hypothetical protein
VNIEQKCNGWLGGAHFRSGLPRGTKIEEDGSNTYTA